MLPRGVLLATGSLLSVVASPTLAQQTPGVELGEVQSVRLEQTVILPAELRPFQAVDLRAKVVGFVERISVDRGSRVRTGELIAELAAPELDARMAEAEAERATAEANLAEAQARSAASSSTYERLAEAAETPGVVAGNDLERAEKTAEADRARMNALAKGVDAAQAALASVRQMTDYLNVTAPFDGVVTERLVHVGSLVGPGTDATYLVRLEQVGRLRLVTPVPEIYAATVVRGAELSFSVRAYLGESFTAVVARPAMSISPETRTMAVEADFDNREGRLAPGMYAEVKWTAKRNAETLVVPRSAVVETTERIFVIRARDGKAEWVDVRRGAIQGDRVEVIGQLSAGDRIVLRATDEIRPGAAIPSR